jgi:hypothetical protein
MKPDAPLIITTEVMDRLHRLRDFAAKRPVSMPVLMEALKTPTGKRDHLKRMTAQSIRIAGPWVFFVTFSIETGHPVGVCRHMSMSIMREGRVPHPAAVWMIAAELGFIGAMENCTTWMEDLSDGGKAINVVQPLAMEVAGHA